jgi:hypothetical protein
VIKKILAMSHRCLAPLAAARELLAGGVLPLILCRYWSMVSCFSQVTEEIMSKRRGTSPVKIIGFVLLAAGIVVLAIGIYQFMEFRNSFGGKLSSGANKIVSALGGSGKMAGGYRQPVILIASGAIAAAAGCFIALKR